MRGPNDRGDKQSRRVNGPAGIQHAEIIEVRAQDGSPPWELSESDSGDAPFKYHLRDFEHGHTYALMTTDLDVPVQDVRLRKLD